MSKSHHKSYLQLPLYTTESITETALAKKVYPKGILSSAFPRAWDKGLTGKGIKVAVLDTGIDGNHPDLRGKVIKAVNLTNEGLVVSHGTHVSGTIAANGSLIGGAYDAELIDIKVITKSGGNIDTIMKGITRAADEGAHIINMSVGGNGLSTFDISRLNSVVQYAWNKGTVCISAAGNNGVSLNTPDVYSYPASADRVKSVGSCDVGDTLDSIQLNVFSNENAKISLTACGSNVLSTIIGGKYAIYNGTSMATPHVSALAAILAQSIAGTTKGSNFSNSLVSLLGENILPINKGLILPAMNAHFINESYGAGFLRYGPRDGPYIPQGNKQYYNNTFVGYTN